MNISRQQRVIAWFSCGAASAVAARMAVVEHKDQCVIVNCDTLASEHPDNRRFFFDVQDWIGVPIVQIRSQKYESINNVFAERRFMAGPKGALCTTEMKKIPRFNFQRPDDIHIFGYTAEEGKRQRMFSESNPELFTDWILGRNNVSKADCLQMISDAGIVLPAMYKLGYKNNNCIGCVKATSALYWNMIRRDFPAVFKLRCQQSRELGVRLVRMQGERLFLDRLPESYLSAEPLEDISCGPECTTTQ